MDDMVLRIQLSLRTRDAVQETEGKIEELAKRYREAVGELRIELRELRAGCSHPAPKYIWDASGNNDSEELCLFCGERAKSLSKVTRAAKIGDADA